MKIVYICANYSPFVGGVEIHAHQIAQWMIHRHKVVIAARNFAIPHHGRLAMFHHNLLTPSHPDTNDGVIPVYSLTPNILDRLFMAPIFLRAVPKMRRWLYHPINRITHISYHRVISPRLEEIIKEADVVHSLAHGDLGWSAEAIARKFGVPFICTPFVHPKQWGDGPNDINLYRRSDAVIALVKSDACYLESLGVDPSRIIVIGVSPNLPSIANAARFRKKYNLDDKFMVLYVGRMMAQKGASALLEAAVLAEEQLHKYAFIFIGPGSAEEIAIFYGAPKSVQYLGKVDLQEKADAFAACNIFCMPSMSEILPTVYLEAWSNAKPVIGGLADGLHDLVEGNNAGINVAQDPQTILSALECYYNDPDLAWQHGANGQRLVENNYGIQAVGSQLEELYRTVITKRTGSCSIITTQLG